MGKIVKREEDQQLDASRVGKIAVKCGKMINFNNLELFHEAYCILGQFPLNYTQGRLNALMSKRKFYEI